MPSITVIGKNAPPKQKLNWLCFPSPDSRWTVKLHSGEEWHHAWGYSVSLFLDGRDVSESHPKLTAVENPKGYCTAGSTVWSFDSRDIFLTNWNSNSVLRYRVSSKRVQEFCGLVMSLQCARDRDRILRANMKSACIVNASGKQIASFEWQSPKYEMPILLWLQPSSCVAVIGRSSRRAKTQIRFHSSEDGSVVQQLPLDPRDLLPFDDEAFKGIGRRTDSLQLSQNTWAVGELLDIWSDCRFDPITGDLYLSCYRPTSLPFRGRCKQMCKVKKVWVKCRITQ